MKLTRRKLIVLSVAGGLGTILYGYFLNTTYKRKITSIKNNAKAKVYVIKTSNRSFGVKKLLKQFNLEEYRRKRVTLKANFNSADPFPASTHIETLESVVKELKSVNVNHITLAERSGMGYTRNVLKQKGVFDLSEKMNFSVLVLDEEGKDEWVKIDSENTHWKNGFYISRHFLDTDKVIQICCLKTHRFGGHFTMSLKNSIGLIAKQVPGERYNYMLELHTSPHQRLMIAEVNRFYNVDLVIMDALKAFVRGGPERGDVVEPKLLLASKDRVALDAVGVAILRSYETTKEVSEGKIFELEQIRRAAEIGVGVKSAKEIKLIPLNDESVSDVKKIENILKSQG